MTDNRTNTIAGLAIALSVAILAWLLVELIDSKPGEIAGALGGVVGGALGALGSAAAVYLMLKGQREDEIEKVSSAILQEMAELVKAPIGQLSICAQMRSGLVIFPKSELKRIFHTPTPIIYPAVADRISRLPWPTLVVTFYSQLQETPGLVALIENHPPADGPVTGDHIGSLADLLISQCQIAKMILSTVEPNADHEAALESGKRRHMVRVLDEELTAARQAFPDAESFRDQQR